MILIFCPCLAHTLFSPLKLIMIERGSCILESKNIISTTGSKSVSLAVWNVTFVFGSLDSTDFGCFAPHPENAKTTKKYVANNAIRNSVFIVLFSLA